MSIVPMNQVVSTQGNSGVLSGWKDIAAYMGRGVRTVQRWEQLGLPVRRPNAHLRSAVIATVEEIDDWIRKCGDGRSLGMTGLSKLELLTAEVDRMRTENEALRCEVEALKRHMQQVRTPSSKSARASSQPAA